MDAAEILTILNQSDQASVKEQLVHLSGLRNASDNIADSSARPVKRPRHNTPMTSAATAGSGGVANEAENRRQITLTNGSKLPVPAPHRHLSVQQPNGKAAVPARTLSFPHTNSNYRGNEMDVESNDIGAASEQGDRPIPWREDNTRTVGLPGHVKTIELVDFMCHKHMKMEFAPHVTFVYGLNGSGKSATLQALQCALGVKASQTGRSANQKGFVRTGADEAIVRVTLWNIPYDGRDAFRHDVYGDTITVERRISATGPGSGWAFKDHKGRAVTRKKDELDALLTAISVDASNPVTVMTQDTSRSFLQGSSKKSDREKFELYMEATQLGAIAEELEKSKLQVQALGETASKSEDKLKSLQKKEKEASLLVQQIRDLEVWKEEVDKLQCLLAWSVVAQHEKYIAEIHSRLENAPAEEARLKAEIEELSAEAQTLSTALEQRQLFLQNFELEMEQASQLKKETAEEMKAIKRQILALRRKVEGLSKDKDDGEMKKRELENAVAEAGKDAAENAEMENLAYVKELEKLDARRREIEEEVRKREQVLHDVDDKKSAALEALSEAQEEKHRATGRVTHLETKLKESENNYAQAVKHSGTPSREPAKSWLPGGHPGGPLGRLMAAIEGAVERGRFHRRPIGPIGRHLELNDGRWSRAVDAAIGRAMNNFIVHDTHDQRQIQQLIKTAGFEPRARPWICISKMGLPRHSIPNQALPAEGITTVLSVLSFVGSENEQNAVFNYLVDSLRVERAALASSYEEGKRLVHQRNVNNVFEPDGARRYTRGQSETSVPANQNSNYSNLRVKGKATDLAIKEYHEKIISEVAAQLEAAREQVSYAGALEERAREMHTALCNESREARRAMCASKSSRDRCKADLENLKLRAPSQTQTQMAATMSQGEEAELNDNGSSLLQQDIIMATQGLMTVENDLNEATVELEELMCKEADVKNRYDAVKQQMDRLKQQNTEHVEGYEAEANRAEGLKAKVVERESQLKTLQGEMECALTKLADAEKLAADEKSLAEEVCPREAADQVLMEMKEKSPRDDVWTKFMDDSKFIEKKIERLEKKIRDAETSAGGTLGELELAHAEARRVLEEEGKKIQEFVALQDVLKASLKKRNEKFNQVAARVADTVSGRFNKYLRRKGHYGKVIVNSTARTLQLEVLIGAKNVTQGGGSVKDLKQLSGGERSFTTVAFTLALGAETEMPFRAMDEFDVFMDSVNRRVAMENLLQFAKDNPELQFIFLTPQDMTAVGAAREGCVRLGYAIPEDFIHIVAMKPARQGNV